MKKAIILGAGISGLSIGKMLEKHFYVTILEKDSEIGGIAKTRMVDGIAYHTVGGHCFNSKHPQIMEFVFNLLPKNDWHLTKRLSRIDMTGYEIDYPIEFSIQQIYNHDPELAFNITRDFLSADDTGIYRNLEDWFRKKFGNALSEKYFIPYNSKIWGNDPAKMDYTWVEDKLPIPDKHDFFKALMTSGQDTMPHSSFYYPNSNNQTTLINALADGQKIICNYEVKKIRRLTDKWHINDEYEADILISTIPLNILPKLIEHTPAEILTESTKLRYNKISNVLWRSEPTNKTWTYKPSTDTIFHRYIHIGSFHQPKTNYTITECVGEHSFDEMVSYGKNDSTLIEPIDYNISEHAYVVFDENRDKAVANILSYLNNTGIYSVGRFGKWEYFNMDICMLDALNTARKITSAL